MSESRFTEIINGDRDNEQVVFENDKFIVLTDKYRRTSVGSICLVIPKKRRRNLLELTESESKELIPIINLISKSMQKAYSCNGIRIWTAINKEAGQSIFHCHIHILPCDSFNDRLIANFPGIYDLKRRITGKHELAKSVNYELAEKLRNEINTYAQQWL
jgi:histidine triad (HIT) family protein